MSVALNHPKASTQQLSTKVKYESEKQHTRPRGHDFSVISRHGEQALNNSGSVDKNSDYGSDNGEDLMFNICTAVEPLQVKKRKIKVSQLQTGTSVIEKRVLCQNPDRHRKAEVSSAVTIGFDGNLALTFQSSGSAYCIDHAY